MLEGRQASSLRSPRSSAPCSAHGRFGKAPRCVPPLSFNAARGSVAAGKKVALSGWAAARLRLRIGWTRGVCRHFGRSQPAEREKKESHDGYTRALAIVRCAFDRDPPRRFLAPFRLGSRTCGTCLAKPVGFGLSQMAKEWL